MKKLICLIFLIVIIGCSSDSNVINDCIDLCKEQTMDLTSGPCIGNPIKDDWVCDIAHSPKIALDNLPENQCSAYRSKEATHFIELDENCELIKVY